MDEMVWDVKVGKFSNEYSRPVQLTVCEEISKAGSYGAAFVKYIVIDRGNVKHFYMVEGGGLCIIVRTICAFEVIFFRMGF